MFPVASEEAVDFLNKTLRFNPQERMTIDECIEHPLMNEVRQSEKEKTLSDQITFDFENEEIDTEARLRELFVEQIKLLILP